MTAQLIAPGYNQTPRTVAETAPGMIALDMTCITPAIRWYTLADLEAVNGRAAVAQACKAPVIERHTVKAVDMGMYFICARNSWDAAQEREWSLRENDNYFAEEDSKEYWISLRNRVERGFYARDLEQQIAEAVKYPEPLKLVDFDVYPQAVFLAAANYYLHSQVLYLDPVAVEKSAAMIAKAS